MDFLLLLTILNGYQFCLSRSNTVLERIDLGLDSLSKDCYEYVQAKCESFKQISLMETRKERYDFCLFNRPDYENCLKYNTTCSHHEITDHLERQICNFDQYLRVKGLVARLSHQCLRHFETCKSKSLYPEFYGLYESESYCELFTQVSGVTSCLRNDSRCDGQLDQETFVNLQAWTCGEGLNSTFNRCSHLSRSLNFELICLMCVVSCVWKIFVV